ncbi:hypothetical protein IJT93_04550 [bacterium]|nr:hypothetical protein [bacterium]
MNKKFALLILLLIAAVLAAVPAYCSEDDKYYSSVPARFELLDAAGRHIKFAEDQRPYLVLELQPNADGTFNNGLNQIELSNGRSYVKGEPMEVPLGGPQAGAADLFAPVDDSCGPAVYYVKLQGADAKMQLNPAEKIQVFPNHPGITYSLHLTDTRRSLAELLVIILGGGLLMFSSFMAAQNIGKEKYNLIYLPLRDTDEEARAKGRRAEKEIKPKVFYPLLLISAAGIASSIFWPAVTNKIMPYLGVALSLFIPFCIIVMTYFSVSKYIKNEAG